MEVVGELQKLSPLISQSPWSFLAVAIALLTFGWVAGRVMSHERIQALKERVEDYQDRLDGASPDEARQRLDCLEARVKELSPRRLSSEQIDTIAQAVSGFAGEIHIVQDLAAGDARTFASTPIAAFGRAAWRVSTPTVMGIGNLPPSGLALVVVDPSNLDMREAAIRDALAKAGVSFDIRPGRRGKDRRSILGEDPAQNDAELLISTTNT